MFQDALDNLVQAFHKYSGNSKSLTKGEMKKLLNNELKGLLGLGGNDKGTLDMIFQSMDADRNGKINFQEYMELIGQIAMLSGLGYGF